MFIVSYDFSNDKRRARFSRFLERYGVRIQYSVFQIKQSPRVMQTIMTEIRHHYQEFFDKTDSILIYPVCQSCEKKIVRYGAAKLEESEVIVFD